MVVISYPAIKSCIEKHTDATDAMNNWYRVMTTADFATYRELKEVFTTVEGMGNDRYVFDIKGNKYRIVAMIHFNVRTVYIRFAGTHREYDKIDAKNI
jgi:mRNA interferase HigB